MREMNAVDWVAFILVVVGGINWGLVGLFELDLVAELFGELSAVSKIVYTLVGLATVYLLVSVLMRKNTTDAITRD